MTIYTRLRGTRSLAPKHGLFFFRGFDTSASVSPRPARPDTTSAAGQFACSPRFDARQRLVRCVLIGQRDSNHRLALGFVTWKRRDTTELQP